MDNVQKHNICTNVPSSQAFRSYSSCILHVLAQLDPPNNLLNGTAVSVLT
jgi:hypothetical protein